MGKWRWGWQKYRQLQQQVGAILGEIETWCRAEAARFRVKLSSAQVRSPT